MLKPESSRLKRDKKVVTTKTPSPSKVKEIFGLDLIIIAFIFFSNNIDLNIRVISCRHSQQTLVLIGSPNDQHQLSSRTAESNEDRRHLSQQLIENKQSLCNHYKYKHCQTYLVGSKLH
jgi:hypothetical protein